MKVVILAGGRGTRISEESVDRPKPLVEIGGWPLIWHIMKIYSSFGLNEFIICLGYKGYMIKEYFDNYFLHMSDVTLDMKTNSMEVHQQNSEDWRITLVNTGLDTATGGRIKRILRFLNDKSHFALTYGDGIANVDIQALIEFHSKHGKLATVTAVQPALRFGALEIDDHNLVNRFHEKSVEGGGWINGGFFILSPDIGGLIDDDNTPWEAGPLESLASSGELYAFRHDQFWHPVDTLRDKMYLEDLWSRGKAPWKLWE